MGNFNPVKNVKTPSQIKVIDTIKKLRKKKKLGFRRIGDILDLNKAAVYMILNEKWYPKTSEVEQRILAKIREIENDL